MHVPARALGEPVADRPGFVGCVVVHDDVNVEVGRHVALDLIQEFAELARAVASHALADHADLDFFLCGGWRMFGLARGGLTSSARADGGRGAGDDGARFHIECREQRCRSVPL